MKTRVLVAAVGIPVLLLVVLWGPDWVIMAALCALAGIAGVELQRCVSGGKAGNWTVTLISAAYPVAAVILYSMESAHVKLLSVLFFSEVVLVFLLAKLLFRYRLEGLENLRKGDGSWNAAVIAGNHASMVDPVFVWLAAKTRVRFMAKQELFEKNALLLRGPAPG